MAAFGVRRRERHLQDFRRLKVWNKAHGLMLDLYRVTRRWPASERFGLSSQIRRAAASIAANIVEGTARGTERETMRFLRISFASAAELQYHLILARDLGLITESTHRGLELRLIEVKRMLTGFIRHLMAEG